MDGEDSGGRVATAAAETRAAAREEGWEQGGAPGAAILWAARGVGCTLVGITEADSAARRRWQQRPCRTRVEEGEGDDTWARHVSKTGKRREGGRVARLQLGWATTKRREERVTQEWKRGDWACGEENGPTRPAGRE